MKYSYILISKILTTAYYHLVHSKVSVARTVHYGTNKHNNSVLSQLSVFTSVKSAQYVQIFLLGRKQMSRIPQYTSHFRGAGVRTL